MRQEAASTCVEKLVLIAANTKMDVYHHCTTYLIILPIHCEILNINKTQNEAKET